MSDGQNMLPLLSHVADLGDLVELELLQGVLVQRNMGENTS